MADGALRQQSTAGLIVLIDLTKKYDWAMVGKVFAPFQRCATQLSIELISNLCRGIYSIQPRPGTRIVVGSVGLEQFVKTPITFKKGTNLPALCGLAFLTSLTKFWTNGLFCQLQN